MFQKETIQILTEFDSRLSHLELNKLVAAGLDFIVNQLNIPHLSIALIEENKKVFCLYDVRDPLREIATGQYIDFNHTVLSEVIQSEDPVYRPDILKENTGYEVDSIVTQEGVRSDFLIPLIIEGKCIGTLNCASKQIDGISERKRRILKSLSPRLAQALMNSKLFGELRKAHAELEHRVSERTAELEKANRNMMREIEGRKQMEREVQKRTADLDKRIRELNCLYRVSNLVEKGDIPLEEILQGVVNLIPQSRCDPETACSRILLRGKEYRTRNFKKTGRTTTSNLIVRGKNVGVLEIYYLSQNTDKNDTSSIIGERSLIDAIAGRLGRFISRLMAEEELKWEINVNASLSKLYEPLISPSTTIKDITHLILKQARKITDSEIGYVTEIDPVSGDCIGHTLSALVEGKCKISGAEKRIVFPKGKNGKYAGLWGYALNTVTPLFTNSPQTHLASKGLPDGHMPIHNFLSIPVMLGEDLVGQIALGNKAGEYTKKDLEAVSRLADYYSLAIQRKRWEETLRIAHEDLEQRVDERTAELIETTEHLAHEIEERRRAEAALKDLSSKRLNAHEEESKRIGQELHDGLAQTLSAIKVWVEAALLQVNEDSSERLYTSLKTVIPLAQGAVEEVRRIIMNLRPSILDDLGILPTISWLCQDFGEIYSHIRIERELEIKENRVPETLKIVIYRILQEALNNIGKHSDADLVDLTLCEKNHTIELKIKDNGKGFDVDQVVSGSRLDRGLGLDSMRERAALSRGILSVKSKVGAGTTITASWKITSN